MSKEITIKYYLENESAREPYQATQGSAGMTYLQQKLKLFYKIQLELFH